MVKRVIKISILVICALAVIYLLFGRTLRRWITPLDTVVGKVGEDTVTLKDVNAAVDYTWIIINGSSREAYESVLDGKSISETNTITLDYCINQRLFVQKAKEMGLYPLSEADMNAAKAKAELYYFSKAIRFKQAGVSKEELIQIETDKKTEERLREEITKQIYVTDAEVKEMYDSMVADKKIIYAESPNAYQFDRYVDDEIIVYRPEELRVVKHIMIPFPADIAEQTIIGYKDADQLKKLINDNLPKIQAQADEVLAQAQAGGDFDKLMAVLMQNYSPIGNEENDFYMDSEYEIGDCIGNFHTELKEAAFALEHVGDMTGLIATENGYHILKWVGNVPSGPVPFEEVKEAIKVKLLETMKTAVWQVVVEQWEDETKIEKYPDRIP